MTNSLLGQLLSAAIAALLAATALVFSRAPAEPQPPPERVPAQERRPVVGRDVSWPNCPRGMGIPSRRSQGKPMPPPSALFVVIGLTNGPAFHPNPCLGAQVEHARRNRMWASAYAVATFPTPAQLRRYGDAGPRDPGGRRNRLWNTGWAQARQNLTEMRKAGLPSPMVWVDVEPVSDPAPWSDRPADNRAVVEGAVESYRRAGLRVGFYSAPGLWRDIVGTVEYGLPEWRTAGLSTRRAALAACGRVREFQGGPPVLTQWYTDREDFDVFCPGRPTAEVLREYFVRP
jgi:hypothetical protein